MLKCVASSCGDEIRRTAQQFIQTLRFAQSSLKKDTPCGKRAKALETRMARTLKVLAEEKGSASSVQALKDVHVIFHEFLTHVLPALFVSHGLKVPKKTENRAVRT